ncbi:MAG: class I SAM-dependent methyltransferase [Thaumarchaeota archaeon]|nr:class I SAM-dependent methyltransferase [Nitrososphaerota archaeon]
MELSVVESPKVLVKQFFGNNAKSYDKVVGITTFGKDSHWKEEIMTRIPKCGSILDLACGTGILTFKIAEKFPDAKITGADITEEYLLLAKDKTTSCHKISFLLCDAEDLHLDDVFDCITSSYIPKYCNPQILVERCLQHMSAGGKIILHDFTYPKNKAVRLLWNLYFVTLNMIGFFTPRWKDVFRHLPKLIRSADWVEQYKDAMERKGLSVEVTYLTIGCSAILAGTKKV